MESSAIAKEGPELPKEMLIEILMRLPAKSLMRFKCVSKLWLTLISSAYFSNLFLKHSSSRPQRFFLYIGDERKQPPFAMMTSTSTHDHSVFDTDVEMSGMGGRFMNAVCGLACFRLKRGVLICNPNTRQLVEYPQVATADIYSVWYGLGYDPVHNEYKVLGLDYRLAKDLRVIRSEYHVLVLGPRASWRKIRSQYTFPHKPYPYTSGVSVNGVLYYRTSTSDWNESDFVIVSFDLSSEEFHLIQFPNDPRSEWQSNALINYKGKLALVSYLGDGILNLWVLEDAKKSQWSDKKTSVMPSSLMNYDNQEFHFMRATSYSGKIWFKTVYTQQPSVFFVYDLERNEITQRIQMLNSFTEEEWVWVVCWEDTESITYLHENLAI